MARRPAAPVATTLSVWEVAKILRTTPRDVLIRAKKKPPPANPRVRAYKQRLKRGAIVLRVEVTELPLVDYLIDTGRLTDTEALMRPLVEKAVSEVLRDLTDRWRTEKSYA
jgi:hypothetical protein